MDHSENFMDSALFEFKRYKALGDKTFSQLSSEEILWTLNHGDNSISLIVKHMVGNMLSRWTNFMTADGEKPWRNREAEFEGPYGSKSEMLRAWEQGWQCLFDALATINSANFNTLVLIRNEEHTVMEAMLRQLAHYANHVGQIVMLGKMIKGKDWVSLSIPRGGSEAFNKKKFEE
tara:strand:+ start:686 stop:1213 length:528 start_codon:yes stop_codon:yes gene_type:complete